MQRFDVAGLGTEVYGGLVLRHRDCPSRWVAQIDTFGYSDEGPCEPALLAELNQRAEEHAEVCQ